MESKLKCSQPHNLEVKQRKANHREQQQMMASFEALAAEAQRLRMSTTTRCEFIGRGCCHPRGFLTQRGAAMHALTCAFRPDKAASATAASVWVRVRVGGVVQLSLRGSGHTGLHGKGHVVATLSLVSTQQCAARVTLSTRRPLVGSAYGLQPHRAVHELSTAKAQADAVMTRPKDVRALLLIKPGLTHVHLTLSCRRLPPEMRVRVGERVG